MSRWFDNDVLDDEDVDEREECLNCGGDRVLECDCTGGCGKEFANFDCPLCNGSGKQLCPECNGRGYK